MSHSKIASQTQADIRVQGQIDQFFSRFRIGSLLHRCGIRKRNGYSVRSLTKTIFTLPFVGQNFFRGIVINTDIAFGKDAAYELLKGSTYNWRRLLMLLARRLFAQFDRLTDDERDCVFILDDSTYERSRSKAVELLTRVWDHGEGRFIKGLRMLTLCWSDGASCLPLDFCLLSSSNAAKRLCGERKHLDKRCCAYQRRQEAIEKATCHLEAMVKRALSAGIRAKYLLMDSWFTMPATVTTLAVHLPVIGMVKKTSKVLYGFQGKRLDVKAIYRRLSKKRGRAKILASAAVTLGKKKVPAKLVFVRDRRKKDWLAILSTDTELADAEIVRIYGKRWDIEVFFKMAKQHLRLAKEIQCRDFDALVAHTSIVFMRYMFLSYQCRMLSDQRSFGDLFHACCDEVRDISFMQALLRILSLTTERMRQLGAYCEKTFQDLYYSAVRAAVEVFNLSKNSGLTFLVNPES
jgi:hypothetical protein